MTTMTTIDKVKEEIAKIDKDRLHLVEAFLASKLLGRLHKKALADDIFTRLKSEELIVGKSTLEYLNSLEDGMYAVSNALSSIDSEEAFAFNYAVSKVNKHDILKWPSKEGFNDGRDGIHDIDPETGENKYFGEDMTDAEMFGGETW